MRSIALLTPFLAVLSSLCDTVIVTKRYPRASQITSAAPPCIGSTYAALLEHHRLRPSAGIPYSGVLRPQLSHGHPAGLQILPHRLELLLVFGHLAQQISAVRSALPE